MQQTLLTVINRAQQELGQDAPLTLLSTLLAIPIKTAIPLTELKKLSGLTNAGVSRILATLSNHKNTHRRKMPYKMIEIYEDVVDRRYKVVKLTSEGQRFMQDLISHCSDKLIMKGWTNEPDNQII